MHDPTKELLKRAIFLLANNYNQEEDSFFLVVTKDGKKPGMAVSAQTIIGEINLKSLLSFLTESINQYCVTANMHPHVFIARYLTSSFVAQDQSQLFDVFGVAEDMDLDEDYSEEYFREDDVFGDIDEEEEEYIYVTNAHWDDIKN
jgi:hypothetical protein